MSWRGRINQVHQFAELASLGRDTVLNLLGAALPTLITVVTVPIYLRAVGNARYGVLTLVWLIVAYFGLFDLGLGRAATNALAKLRDGPIERKTEVFWSAFWANLGLGCIGGALSWAILQWYSAELFGVPADVELELVQAVPYLALSVPVVTVSSVITGALDSHRDFWSANAVGLIGSTMASLLPLIVALRVGPALPGLVGAAVISRGLAAISGLWACYRSGVFRGLRLPSLRDVQDLLGYGAWVSVSSVVGPVLVSLDRFIIASFLGAQMVPYYSVPFSLITRVQLLAGSLQRSLFPRFSSVAGERARQVARQSVIVLSAVMTPVMVLVAFLLEPFLAIWVGPDYARYAGPVGAILVFGIWVNSLAFVPYSLLQAEGRPDVTAKFHLVELAPYLCALLVGVKVFGLEGAAIAWSLRVLADAILLFTASRLAPRWAWSQLVPASIVAGSCLLGQALPNSLGLRLVAGSALAGVAVVWSWRTVYSRLN